MVRLSSYRTHVRTWGFEDPPFKKCGESDTQRQRFKRKMQDDVNKKLEEEIQASFSIFILMTLLILSFATSYGLKSYKVKMVHESIISLGMG
jgi:hypothetical protein